jgi:hypothetical protein
MSKESRDESKTIRELRKQLARINKENQQLRKENNRLLNAFEVKEDEIDSEYERKFEKIQTKPEPKRKCQHCGSKEIHTFELREKIYFKCHDCEKKGQYQE